MSERIILPYPSVVSDDGQYIYLELNDPAQRLALARALAPEAFAVVDAAVDGIGYDSDAYQEIYEAIVAYQQVATPESSGEER